MIGGLSDAVSRKRPTGYRKPGDRETGRPESQETRKPDMTTEDAMSPEHGGEGRSLGQLFASATAEVSALVHDEIALAKAELREDARRAAIGSGALVGALALAVFAVPMVSMAIAYGIQWLGLPLGWAFLIVGVAYLVLAVLLAVVARGRFRKVKK